MKNKLFILIATAILLLNCNGLQKKEKPASVESILNSAPQTENKKEKVIVVDEDGKELVLTKEEFLSIYNLAKRYIALKEDINSVTTYENVKVSPIDENTYNVQIRLNDELSLTAIVEVNNEELNELRWHIRRGRSPERQRQISWQAPCGLRQTRT